MRMPSGRGDNRHRAMKQIHPRGSGRAHHRLRLRRGGGAKEAANGNKAGIGPKASPMPDAFISIAPDDSVTVLIKHLDMGQGVTTGLTSVSR